jgi:hypothetical protein
MPPYNERMRPIPLEAAARESGYRAEIQFVGPQFMQMVLEADEPYWWG